MIKKGNPTKDGRCYYFRVSYKNNLGIHKEHISGKYLTKKECLQAEINFRNSLKEPKGNFTFGLLLNKYLENLKTKIKPTSYAKSVNECKYLQVLNDYKIKDLNLSHVELLKSNLKGCINYKNKILGRFILVIEFGTKFYDTPNTVIKYIEKYKNTELKKEMNFYTQDEYNIYRSVIDDETWLLFFDMLFYLGFRIGELQALTWNDIDFNKEEVSISHSLTTKLKGIEYLIQAPKTKNSIRILPIPKKLLNRLKIALNKQMCYKDYSKSWFVFGCSIPFKDTTIQKHKNKYIELAGLHYIRIHDFRHSCASMLIHSGASIQLVSKYLGHSSIDITLKTYTHFYKNELDSIKIKLDNLI